MNTPALLGTNQTNEQEYFCMENLNFDFQLDEFMLFCRSRQLREKTMISYEQSLRLFERWCWEQLKIDKVDLITESVIRRYPTQNLYGKSVK